MTLPAPDGDRAKLDMIAETLDRFAKSSLAGLTVLEPSLSRDWRATQPQGLARQAQTLAFDIGAYSGEVGIRCARKHAWVIDETRYRPQDLMPTAGRVVIGHDPAVRRDPMRNPVDAIAIAAFALREIVKLRKNRRAWRPNYFIFIADVADERHV